MTKPRKRYRMTKFRIDEASYVDQPAQAGATALFMKRDAGSSIEVPYPALDESLPEYVTRLDAELAKSEPRRANRLQYALSYYEDRRYEKCGGDYGSKSVPVMTSNDAGHAHLVWLRGERGGETSYSSMRGEDYSHGHPWTISPQGVLTIGASRGHTHEIEQSAVLAAVRELMLATTEASPVVADVVFARSADGAPVDVEKAELAELVAGLEDGSLRMTVDGEVFGKAYLADGTYPIRTQTDLASAIAMAGVSPSADVARHIVKRARVLGLEGEGIVALVEVAKSIARPAGELTPEVKMTDVKKGAEAPAAASAPTAEEFAKVKGELEVARAEATLSDRQRAHYQGLADVAKSAFLKLDSAARDAAVAAVEGSNPVVFKSADGTEFRKNDDPRLVSLAKRNDEQAAALAKATSDQAQAVLEKRATDELPHMAGSVQARAALLKAVDGIADEVVRKSVSESLKAANTAAAGVFVKRGSGNAAEAGSAEAQLDTLAKARMAEKGEDYFTAYAAVSKANPKLEAEAITKPAASAS